MNLKQNHMKKSLKSQNADTHKKTQISKSTISAVVQQIHISQFANHAQHPVTENITQNSA